MHLGAYNSINCFLLRAVSSNFNQSLIRRQVYPPGGCFLTSRGGGGYHLVETGYRMWSTSRPSFGHRCAVGGRGGCHDVRRGPTRCTLMSTPGGVGSSMTLVKTNLWVPGVFETSPKIETYRRGKNTTHSTILPQSSSVLL